MLRYLFVKPFNNNFWLRKAIQSKILFLLSIVKQSRFKEIVRIFYTFWFLLYLLRKRWSWYQTREEDQVSHLKKQVRFYVFVCRSVLMVGAWRTRSSSWQPTNATPSLPGQQKPALCTVYWVKYRYSHVKYLRPFLIKSIHRELYSLFNIFLIFVNL